MVYMLYMLYMRYMLYILYKDMYAVYAVYAVYVVYAAMLYFASLLEKIFEACGHLGDLGGFAYAVLKKSLREAYAELVAFKKRTQSLLRSQPCFSQKGPYVSDAYHGISRNIVEQRGNVG